ncbi:oligosaccharide flippase family protein [Patescibacteria group bacterium]|nr:oligosaccharide flippase family protein [Patescibacteria group bacterium]
MKEKIRSLYADTLFRNSFYLMLNTVVMAGLGFGFWLISAHLFSPSDIGIASGLISAMALISYVSLLGFNNTFVRVLPTSTNRSTEINTGLLLSLLVAVVVAIGYLIAIPHIAPRLDLVNKNLFYSLGFIALAVFATMNMLTDSIFIALRAAKYNLLIDGGITSGIKMLLPFVFVSLGAYGVFASAGVAAGFGMIASIIFLIYKFEYRPRLHIHRQTVRSIFHYSFASYLANLLNIAPTLVLPLLIINRLGPAPAGYYYLAFMMANLLYAVAYSISQSLFAEGSYGDISLEKLARRSVVILGVIMIPAALILGAAGPFILQIFGKSYGVEASPVLITLSLAAPAVAAYSIGNVLLRLRNKIYSIIAVNVVYFAGISGFAILWVGKGLTWIGFAWIIGNVLAALLSFILFYADEQSRTVRTSV